ncbi:MAG: hypothetical protein WAK36_01230, partial [Pseudolabrys sp.]
MLAAFLNAPKPSARAFVISTIRRDGILSSKYRWADGNYDRIPALVEDLIRLKVDVIDTHGTPGVCAKQADVRFWGKSGDEDCAAKCLLMTQSGHC